MKNLVLVTQVFHPNTQSTSLLLTDLALHLQSDDIDLTVVCGCANLSDNLFADRYEDFQGIKIHRCGVPVDLKRGMLQRLVSYVSFLLHAGWKLLFLPQKDIMIGVSNPPFLSIFLMVVSWLTNAPYHFIIHDMYPEGLVAVNKISEKSWITALWRKLNDFSYRYASKLVVLGRDMKDLVLQNYTVASDKIVCIPNWSLTAIDSPTPFEENELAHELGLQDKFVVQYSGNMGLWHDIDTFVRAAAKLQTNQNIQFLFIGNGIRQKQAQQLAHDLELKNIIWMDFVPKEQLSMSLTCAHVALISLQAGLEGIAVPCKLYGILGSGRAILAQVPAKSEIAYTIVEENCGFVISPGDVEGLVEKMEQLAKDQSLTREMGINAFQACKSKYTIKSVVEQFELLLKSE
jgi:colanic acid biosynthesis glycosyl transferase WcaI